MCDACNLIDTPEKLAEDRLNLDIPRLRKLVEWVEEQEMLPKEQREWDQSIWMMRNDLIYSCGTAFCVAGKTVYEWGEEFGFKLDWQQNSLPALIATEDMDIYGHFYLRGDPVGFAEAASRILGLSEGLERDAAHLVGGSIWAAVNTAEDIRRIAETIAGEKL